LLAKKYGASDDYTKEIAAEEQELKNIKVYQAELAKKVQAPVIDNSMLTKLLNGASTISLLVIFGFASQVMFFSESMSIYAGNKSQFEIACFICTIIYFVTAYWSLKRHKILNTTT